MSASATPERRIDLDWLRILAVLLLIPFHSARIFNQGEPFYVKNAEDSTWLTFVVGFLAQWQMPLLFLLAGAATWYALRFRSGGQYVRERLKRLLVPFVFGTLVIIPPQMYLALLHRASTSASYLAYYPEFFQIRPLEIPDYTGIGFSWGHLWFILHLFVTALIALPLFLFLRSGSGQRLPSRLAGFFDRGWAIFLLALPLPFVVELPDFDNKPIFMHLTVFIYGFVLVSDPRFGRALVRNRRAALILAIISMSIMFGVWLSGAQFADKSLGDILTHFVENFNPWFWLMTLLGFGQQYLTADNRVLRYARDAAYPFYVLHQTVIVVIGFYVVQWSVDLNAKYFVIVAASLAATIALYDVLVRRTNVTRWLFGMKPMTRPALGHAAPESAR